MVSFCRCFCSPFVLGQPGAERVLCRINTLKICKCRVGGRRNDKYSIHFKECLSFGFEKLFLLEIYLYASPCDLFMSAQ